MPTVGMSVLVLAEVQDSLLVVMNDLQRLEGLVNHAADNLLDRFSQAIMNLSNMPADPELALQMTRETLQLAVTELQFQDMSSQLITHTTKILRACSHQLAAEAMGIDEDEDPDQSAVLIAVQPDRPNPVTQSEMDAGSIDLF